MYRGWTAWPRIKLREIMNNANVLTELAESEVARRFLRRRRHARLLHGIPAPAKMRGVSFALVKFASEGPGWYRVGLLREKVTARGSVTRGRSDKGIF